MKASVPHCEPSSPLLWNSTRTCKRRYPFACFDKWTASTSIPLPDLLQPPWFHSINFQSQRSLYSAVAAATVIATPLAGYSSTYTLVLLHSFMYLSTLAIQLSWSTKFSRRDRRREMPSISRQIFFKLYNSAFLENVETSRIERRFLFSRNRFSRRQLCCVIVLDFQIGNARESQRNDDLTIKRSERTASLRRASRFQKVMVPQFCCVDRCVLHGITRTKRGAQDKQV